MKYKKRIISIISVCFVMILFATSCAGTTEKNFADISYPIESIPSYDSGKEIYVVGHLNPDSDTVFSSISYANFLSEMGYPASARTTGKVNAETAHALEKFGVAEPKIIDKAENYQFILVDHSLYDQSVSGMDRANVIGVVDHHAIGDIITANPALYLGFPVGSTATIVYEQYVQYGVEIDRQMAGIILTAILSDTLGLKSPTTTEHDVIAVEKLMAIAGIRNYEDYTKELFEAGNIYASLSAEEIVKYDYKEYSAGSEKFSIGVVQATDDDQLLDIEEMINAYMFENFDSLGVDMCFMMMTNIVDMETRLLCFGEDALKKAQEAFDTNDEVLVLKDVVSRKKQVAPPLTEALTTP